MLNANLIYMLNNKYKNKNKIEYFMKLRVFKKNIKKKNFMVSSFNYGDKITKYIN